MVEYYSMDIVFIILLILLSIAAIGKGSDWMTNSLVPLARKLGVSGVSVGLVLVSVAVSLPEILVAVTATLKGYTAISLGVALGSIICNIGLMTGLSAYYRPLKISQQTLLRDGVFSVIIPILVFAVSSGGEITRVEGLAFFLLFIPYVINVFLQERRLTKVEKEIQMKSIEIEMELLGFDFGKLKAGWLTFILGTIVLLGGAQLFSDQLISLVQMFGISELLIGLTIGALGPSIPNIVAAYKATQKGMGEIAVSETLGSNIFTLLVTVGILAMLSPISVSEQWINFDLPILIIMSFMLFAFLITKKTLSRFEGFILMMSYILVIIIQIFINL